MQKEVELLPGTRYIRRNGSIAIVADQNPEVIIQPGQPTKAPTHWFSYIMEPEKMTIHPAIRSTDIPQMIVKMLPPVSLEEMLTFLDTSLPEHLQTLALNDMSNEFQQNLAKGPRRVPAPNLAE